MSREAQDLLAQFVVTLFPGRKNWSAEERAAYDKLNNALAKLSAAKATPKKRRKSSADFTADAVAHIKALEDIVTRMEPMAPNPFAVPKKIFEKRWKNNQSRETFNRLYDFMDGNQDLFLHPKAEPADAVHWRTTAWNAAWIAADITSDDWIILPEFYDKRSGPGDLKSLTKPRAMPRKRSKRSKS